MNAKPPLSQAGKPPAWSEALERLLFTRRRAVIVLFAILSAALAWQALALKLEGAFDRAQPARHPYSLVDRHYRDSFGGASPLRIAMSLERGTVYDPAFLVQLQAMTAAVAGLPGIDRGQLRSLVTPELKQVVVDGGQYYSSSLWPADWQAARLTPAQLAELRDHVRKAGLVGRYVSSDERGALIEAAFLDRDPVSGAAYDPALLARALDASIAAIQSQGRGSYRVQRISDPSLFAALCAAIPVAALLALAALLLMLALAGWLLGTMATAAITLGCALLAAVWQLGLMQLAGLALLPESGASLWLTAMLALFCGLLHAARWLADSATGARAGFEASLRSWRRVAAPLAIALLATAAAAITLRLYSDIALLGELALSLALGLMAAAMINGLLLPTLLSSLRTSGLRHRPDAVIGRLLAPLAVLGRPAGVIVVLLLSAALLGWGRWQAAGLQLESADGEFGQLPVGAPLRSDAAELAAAFPHSVEHMAIVVDAARDACTRSTAMEQVDRLAWWLRNVPGVTGTASLPQSVAQVLTAFSDGSPKFAVLSRDRETLTQAVAPISTSGGLHDRDCQTLLVNVQLARHDVATLNAVVDAVDAFNRQNALEFYEAHPAVDAAYCADQQRARARGVVPPALARTCPVLAQAALGPLARSLARQQALDGLREPALALVVAVLAAVAWLLLADAHAAMAITVPLLLAGLVLPGILSGAGVVLSASLLPLQLLALGMGYSVNLLLHQELLAGRLVAAGNSEAWRHALSTAGRGAVIATLVVAAGSALWLPAILPLQRDLGLVLLVTLLLNLLLGLLLLPALAGLAAAPPPVAAPAPRIAPSA